jgi:hypothetical protein
MLFYDLILLHFRQPVNKNCKIKFIFLFFFFWAGRFIFEKNIQHSALPLESMNGVASAGINNNRSYH